VAQRLETPDRGKVFAVMLAANEIKQQIKTS